MKFSKYNLYLKGYPYHNSTLIYNTLTKASVVITDELKEVINKLDEKTIIHSEEDKEYIEQLQNLGIILLDEIDENLLMHYWYNKLRFSSLVWNGVIVPTTDCDLACRYCYQEGAKSAYYMDKGIQDAVVNWYNQKIDKDKPKQVFWTFFGGEPLLHIEAIDYTTDRMAQICNKENVIFQFSIVTNGTNLPKDKIKKWQEHGLISIQITLDGVKEIHDKRRPYINRSGSFDKIFDNLLYVCDANLHSVYLRMNLDAQNINEVPQFLDFLKEYNLQNKLIIFYGLLLEADIELEHQRKYKMEDRVGAKEILNLRWEALNKGFKLTEILEGGPCIAKSECSVLIDPRGKIFKCTGHIGLDNLALGDLSNCGMGLSRCTRDRISNPQFEVGELNEDKEEGYYEQIYSQYVGRQLDDECLNCPFAPICLGGCPYKSYTKFGTIKKKYCDRVFYQTVYEDVLRQMYQEEEVKKKMQSTNT